MADVAVVGAGITGLATAWFLGRQAPEMKVALVEATDRLGGKIRTSGLAGLRVEAGPDTFLARVPWAVTLCRQLGLEEELIAPATAKAYVWTRGRLRPLPAGHVLGVPARLAPLARSGIVSPGGLARAALDLALPRRGASDDPSVAEVVAGRLGSEVVDRLVEPLLGGIHAGRADRLSLAAVAPEVASSAAGSRSLLLGLRRRAPTAPEGPVFLGLRGGLERLVERLRERLEGVEIRSGAPVTSLDELAADAVVLAVPAFAAADLLRPVCPEAASELDAIPYASVATVALAYPPDALPAPLDGSGFVVPRVDGRLITACTWLTSKWPQLASGPTVLLRASAGRFGDDRALLLDDETLVDEVHAELVSAMGLRSRPHTTLVTRWVRAFPQYEPGHHARVARIEAALAAAAPHVLLAGAAYRGVGIAACVHQAEQAAAAVRAMAVR